MKTQPIPSRNGLRRVPVRNIRAVVKQIAAQFNPEKIILFGSYAYGNPKSESDVDVLVVMETSLRNSEQAAQIVRAIDYHFGMDLIVRRPRQPAERIAMGDSFLREIAEKGKIVYARAE